MTDTTSYASTRRWAAILSVLAAVSIIVSFYLIFFWVPTERTMGIVQRIYYIHLPSAIAAYLAFGTVALCSLGYLWLKDERLDAIAVSAAEIGVLFTTAVLIQGPLWARLSWGAWWVWDARTTSTLLLWMIYVSYFVIRYSTENPDRGRRFAAIVGIIGAVDIPIIHMSVQWFRTQHPDPVVLRPEGPTADPEIWQTVLFSTFAFSLGFFALLLYRYVYERLRAQVEALRYQAAIGPSNPAEGAVR